MSYNITVPKEYGYVVLTGVASIIVGAWHGIRVGSFRKAAEVPYPNAYASAEAVAQATTPEKKQALYLFNCAQRAHANYIENHTLTLPALLIAGLEYPRAAAIAGAVWTINRVVYAVGYTLQSKREGKGRLFGELFVPAQLALWWMAGAFGWKMISA